jgi:glycosyltransferase involved in cell wall biosynthesis
VRIAFYAPLKPPTHATPSGDRRVARLLMDALELSGQRIELVSTFRSFDRDGDLARQQALRVQGEAYAQRLIAQWRNGAPELQPELWFTYHLYYKAPDWLGPAVAAALGIPYVIAEASYAPKRGGGPWDLGHDATADAVRRAALVICPSQDDIAGLKLLIDEPRLLHLPPFLDTAPYRDELKNRTANRARLAREHNLDPEVPWIVVAAMMREGDKLASYRSLAASLDRLADIPWHLLIAGDGAARAEIEKLLPGARFFGTLDHRSLAQVYSASDVSAWPAVNEAYGMALLEAQAAGVPVVSSATRGVPEVVLDGRTGLLAPAGDEAAFAQRLRTLLLDPARRRTLGKQAADFVAAERSLEAAAQTLQRALAATRV